MNILPDWISERAFGGTHAAVAPTGKSVPSNWPDGLSAPAAQDVCDLLIDACTESGPLMENTIVFLVGGAGNGKSYLANDVSQKINGKLQTPTSDSMFASRSYDYKLSNGGDLLIVNDATIPRQGSELGASGLVQDMQETLKRGGHMLACVNRGVLIGEVKTSCAKSNGPELAIVKWLLTSGTADHIDSEEWQLTPSDQQSACYAYCKLRQSEKVTHIHVAFMDTISLFEPRPLKVPALNQTVIPLEFKRVELSVLAINKDRYAQCNTIAAYEVLKEFFAHLWLGVSDSVNKGNPEFCNISSLQDERLLKGVCDILRGAEIIGGMQITYRDLWGVALLALQGPKGRNSESYVSEHLDSTANLSKRDRAIAYIKLASRRFHMAIFSARLPDFALGKTEQKDFSEDFAYPTGLIMDALRKADPILGLEEVTKNILDKKLQMLEESAGPGKLLAKSEDDDRFGAVWTKLDEELENALLAWINDEENGISQDERRQVLSWYGKYLTRLYCCSHGQPAYYSLIAKWQQIWNKATPENPQPDEDIRKGLQHLVFMPFINGGGDSFLPLFKPYSTPIVDGQAGSFIALSIPSNEYHWQIKTKGNSVLCELKKHGTQTQSATLALDFPLLREIHIRARTSDGFTDAATEVAPRIERIRAKMLAIENSAENPPTYKFVSKGDILL